MVGEEVWLSKFHRAKIFGGSSFDNFSASISRLHLFSATSLRDSALPPQWYTSRTFHHPSRTASMWSYIYQHQASSMSGIILFGDARRDGAEESSCCLQVSRWLPKSFPMITWWNLSQSVLVTTNDPSSTKHASPSEQAPQNTRHRHSFDPLSWTLTQ